MSEPTLMFTGDLILDEPNPDSFFDATRATLARADIVVGHVEVPHTRRGVEGTCASRGQARVSRDARMSGS